MAISSHEMNWLRKYGPFGVTKSGKGVTINGVDHFDAGTAKGALTKKK